MKNRVSSSRWALWLFAAALLLKSAMPWLASVAAEGQGRDVVEVCTVYGMSMVQVGEADHQPASGHPTGPAADHGGGHCALSALSAFLPEEPLPPVPTSVLLRGALTPFTQVSSQAPDACARWVARLKHGPPALA